MTALWPVMDVIDARKQALRALDRTVRAELSSAARGWALAGQCEVELTAYDRVYNRQPAIGGHWTLFRARATRTLHEVAAVSVTLLFEGQQAVDLVVSGATDVVAGGLSVGALREALAQCGGPLRQVTPLGADGGFDMVAAYPCPDSAIEPLAPSRN